jgi:Zn-dependent alcohol dehydrogenase
MLDLTSGIDGMSTVSSSVAVPRVRRGEQPTPTGHEHVGIVEEVGAEVTTIKPGQFVVGSFVASDNTCEICQAGYQSSCIQNVGVLAASRLGPWRTGQSHVLRPR